MGFIASVSPYMSYVSTKADSSIFFIYYNAGLIDPVGWVSLTSCLDNIFFPFYRFL